MKTFRTFVLAAAFAALGFGAVAQAATDPLLNNKVAEAVVFGGKLWLRGALENPQTGALVSIDLATGARTVHFDRGVIDIDTSDGNLWVVRQATETARVFNLLEWTKDSFEGVGSTAATGIPQPVAMAVGPRNIVLLTPVSIHTFDKSLKRWVAIKLKGALRYGPTMSMAMPTSDNVIYFGANAVPGGSGGSGEGHRGNGGQSVGVLQRIDLSNGSVTAIEKLRTSNPCDGPLSSDCSTVTAIVPDVTNGACVIVSIGLANGEVTDGRVLRVCGADVTVLFEPKAAAQPAGVPIAMTEPIYGLATAPGGFWAISAHGLYRFRGDAHTDFPMSKAENVSGTVIGRSVPDAIVVPTGVQSSQSASGFAVLVVTNE